MLFVDYIGDNVKANVTVYILSDVTLINLVSSNCDVKKMLLFYIKNPFKRPAD